MKKRVKEIIMPFNPDIDKVQKLYFENIDSLFRLAFAHTSISFEASNIISNSFRNVLTSELLYRLATSSEEGIYSLIYKGCIDFYRRKARKKIKAEKLREMKVPFEITDSTMKLLHLPTKLKAPLILHELGFNDESIAFITKTSSKRAEALRNKAASLLGEDMSSVKAAITEIHLSEETHIRNFDILKFDYNETGFAAKQRLKRFKRMLDIAVPFIALGIIIFLVIAYFYTTQYHS